MDTRKTRTMAIIPEYIFEVRRRNASGGFDFLTRLDKRIQPSISQEMGLADVLTFNMPLSDPKFALFTGNQVGLEVWWYGTDRNLKQVFVPQAVEPYRDYGGTSTGSGSGALGSGSGDNALITCDGPETYLTRYYAQNYKVSQRLPLDILNDITTEIIADGILQACYVDPALNTTPLDVDLSWENLKTACDNIIAQIGGFMRVEFTAPWWRRICIRSIPGQLPQPQDVGAESPVLPQ